MDKLIDLNVRPTIAFNNPYIEMWLQPWREGAVMPPVYYLQ